MSDRERDIEEQVADAIYLAIDDTRANNDLEHDTLPIWNADSTVIRKISSGGVKCEECGKLPSIVKLCGDNGVSFNGCKYRLECECGGKGQEFVRSGHIAILSWGRDGFKKQNKEATECLTR